MDFRHSITVRFSNSFGYQTLYVSETENTSLYFRHLLKINKNVHLDEEQKRWEIKMLSRKIKQWKGNALQRNNYINEEQITVNPDMFRFRTTRLPPVWSQLSKI